MFEGVLIEPIEGRRCCSERVVIVVSLADDGVDDPAVGADGAAESMGEAEDGSSALAYERVVVGRRGMQEGVFEQQGTLEGDEAGDGDVEDDDLRRDEQSPELVAGHRFRAAAAGLVLGVCANTSRKSFRRGGRAPGRRR